MTEFKNPAGKLVAGALALGALALGGCAALPNAEPKSRAEIEYGFTGRESQQDEQTFRLEVSD